MKTLFKYLVTFFLYVMIGLIVFDFIALPIITKKQHNIYLPDIKNTSLYNAEKKLLDLGFKVEIIVSSYIKNIIPNTVINMSPRAFTKVKAGRLIKLTVSGNKKNIKVQDFTNMSITNATILTKRQGLLIDTLMYEYNDDIKKNHITSQYPSPGKTLLTNDKISFVVSIGNPPNHYVVPNLINLNFYKGKEILSKSGLLLGQITYEKNSKYLDNTILEQSITPGVKLSFPERLNLILSKDTKD